MTPRTPRIPTLRLALGATALTLIGSVASADIVHLDDVIIDGSACIGFDCVNGETFGFDTLRLKENNLRIKFLDTSTSASFPKNDWQLTANETSNGGQEKFSIDDVSGGRTPFTIEAGAPSHSLYVDDGGRIGLGTSTPVVEIHVKDGDTPTIRLEQDGTSGFTPQIFDVASNETNFFVRDVTNGSTLPLRIRPGAPTSAIDIEGTGDVGINTSAPDARLHVRDGGSVFNFDDITTAGFQNTANAADNIRVSMVSGNTGNVQLAFGDTDNEIAGRIRYNHGADTMDFFTNGSNRAITLNGSGAGDVITTATSAAVLTAAGVWQSVSSRAAKQNIHSLTLSDAQAALRGLEPVTYNYKVEPDELTVGFIAEDVPALVATASHKTLSALDIVAVLTRVVQDQQAIIGSLEEQAMLQDARIEQLEERVAVD